MSSYRHYQIQIQIYTSLGIIKGVKKKYKEQSQLIKTFALIDCACVCKWFSAVL